MEKINQAREQDRALFDFDEDINNLEEVKERYPAAGVPVPNFMRVEEEKSIEDRQEEEPKKVEAPVPAKPPMVPLRFPFSRSRPLSVSGNSR